MGDYGVSETYYRRFLNELQRGYRPSHTQHTTSISTPKKMDTHARVGEIDGIDSSKMKSFPYSSFKLLGALQIGIGALCLLLGITDLLLFLYTSSHYNNDTLKSLTIACVPVWSGLWFIVAGSMGSCMSLQQKSTLNFFKSTFLVLSVLCCLLFGPALFAVEVFIVILRTDGSESAYEWLLPLVIVFFALNEIICALITAAICCCCSPLNQAKVRVIYTRQLDELHELRPGKQRLDTPEIFYTESSRLEKAQNHGHVPVHYGRKDETDSDGGRRGRRDDQADAYDHWDERSQPESNRKLKQLRVEMTSNSPDLTHYSRPPTYKDNTAHSYRRFKQLAIPNNHT